MDEIDGLFSHLKAWYRSDQDDIVDDFYLPCLEVADAYDRAVGFFTSRLLPFLARGLWSLLDRGGRMRLVCSPRLSAHDIDAIGKGYAERDAVVANAMTHEVAQAALDSLGAVELLAWMVGMGHLDIRVAVPTATSGMYHEKFGLFSRRGDDLVAFTGSPNETEAGVFWNFEQIAVFAASELEAREAQRVRDLRADFDALWENTTEGLDVIPFPEAARRQLLQHQPDSTPRRAGRPVRLRAELFPHQNAAIAAWLDAGSKGILEMATGTGKTITALAAAVPSLKAKELILIIVPGVDLLSQWEEVIRERVAGAAVITCGGGNQWTTRLAPFLTRWRLESARPGLGATRANFVLATLDTAASERFLSTVGGIDRSMLIVDEVHRAGSPFRRSALQIASGRRLGLSATPERGWDRDGNKAIEAGIGPVVFRFPLKEAVGTYLTPYDYRPRLISLTDDERVAYADLSRKIQDAVQVLAAKYPQARRDLSMLLQIADPSDAGQLELLLYQRADVLKEAEGKLAMVAEVARDQTVKSCLIYCNDEMQVQHVVDVLKRESRSWGVFTTARVAGQQRKTILRDFGESLFDFLVAIRCLDEGVDMPGATHALILASNRSEREFIQRRGRILRRSPGKEFSVIHDPVVVPFSLDADGRSIGMLSPAEVGIVARELERVELFASAARNDVEALGFIHDVRRLVQQVAPTSPQDFH